MRCAETGRPSRSKISSFKRSWITGLTKSPGKPVPSPRQRPGSLYPRSRLLLCWTARTRPGRTSRSSRTHKKKKRKYSSPSSYDSSSFGSSPRTSPHRGRRHRSPEPRHRHHSRHCHHSRHRSRRSRSGDRRPTSSVSATPARASGSGLPADSLSLEQLLQQTFARFSAAKTALLAFPFPGISCGDGTCASRSSPASKGAHPCGRTAVMLLCAAPLVAPPSITWMLAPPRPRISPLGSPVRSARPQATDDEEVLSEHSGLEVHAQDDGPLDRDIEMQVEEPIPAPIPPPRPVPVQAALDTVSLGDPDDLPSDVSAWQATWSGDKFRFRVQARIQETRDGPSPGVSDHAGSNPFPDC